MVVMFPSDCENFFDDVDASFILTLKTLQVHHLKQNLSLQ